MVLLSVHWRAFKWQVRVCSVIKDRRRGTEGRIRMIEVPSRRNLGETVENQCVFQCIYFISLHFKHLGLQLVPRETILTVSDNFFSPPILSFFTLHLISATCRVVLQLFLLGLRPPPLMLRLGPGVHTITCRIPR